MHYESFFGDDPIDGSELSADKLGRIRFAENLRHLIDHVRESCESSVLALIASWGAGKSSVLQITKGVLEHQTKWRVAEFNPWAFSDLNAMLYGFFAEISAAISEDAKSPELRARIGSLLKSMSDWAKIDFFGVDLTGAIAKAGDVISGDVSPAAKRTALIEALRDANQPVLVILDDLDRLSPDELLLVFKLVRFVGRLPNVYYLLSYDEQTLLDVLAHTDLCASDENRARDYLEKIVQVRIDLPPLRAHQAGGLVMSGIDQLIASHRVDDDKGEMRGRFERLYERWLRSRLSTPRSINRYLAQIDAFFAMLRDEVDFVDFALLTFVRTFEPKLYSFIYKRKEVLTNESHTVHSKVFHKLITSANVHVDHVDSLTGVLAELFSNVHTRKAVGHGDYFDRYFGFGVPEEEEFRDADLQKILTELAKPETKDSSEQWLRPRLLKNTSRMTYKIEQCRPKVSGVTDCVVELYAKLYCEIGDEWQSSDPSVLSRTEALQKALEQALRREMEDAPSRLHRMIVENRDGWLLAARILTSRLRIQARPDTLQLISVQMERASSNYVGLSLEQFPTEGEKLLIMWRAVDRPRFREWVAAQVENGSWNPLDVVDWCLIKNPIALSLEEPKVLPIRNPDGDIVMYNFPEDKYSVEWLDPFRWAVEDILGVDFLIANLADEIDKVDVHSAIGSREQKGLPLYGDIRADIRKLLSSQSSWRRRVGVLASLRLLREDRERREDSDDQ